MVLVRQATAEDRDAVVAMFGRAFEHDPVAVWLNPDPDERASQMAASYGWVFEETSSGLRMVTAGCEAAALWVFSTTKDRSAAAQSSETDAPADEPPSARRMRLMMQSLHAHKPKGDFWHLELAGCEPDRQGKGLGSAVVRAGLEYLGNYPAYLETANSANLGFYRKHGFSVRDEWNVAEDGPHYWSMIRVNG